MQRILVHEKTPNARNIRMAAESLSGGGVVAYPTDTVYGMGVDLTSRRGLERLYALKSLPKNRPLTFLCTDLAEVARYAVVSNATYRLLKRILPGPYTIILEATREVPHAAMTKRRTVGVRIPDHEVPLSLCRALGRPIVSTSATAEEGEPLGDPDLVAERYGRGLDIFLETGPIDAEVSTIISLVDDAPEVLRQGRGPVEGVL
jgi:tRNA threonylcarbamoyl adenosine modification protein (Sua5/YciO/YrdC/YwlC family)